MSWLIFLIILYIFIYLIYVLSGQNKQIEIPVDKEKTWNEPVQKKEQKATTALFKKYIEPYNSVLDKHFRSVDICIKETKRLFHHYHNILTEQGRWDESRSEDLLYYCMYEINYRYCFFYPEYLPEMNKLEASLAISYKGSLKELPILCIFGLNDENQKLLFQLDPNRAQNLPIYYNLGSTSIYYNNICRLAELNRDINIKNVRDLYYIGHSYLANQKSSRKASQYPLRLYLHYLSVTESDVQPQQFHFEKAVQQKAFDEICLQFKIDNDLKKASKQVNLLSKTLLPAKQPNQSKTDRRKIKLNIQSIKEAGLKQKKAALLLDEYLSEEDKKQPDSINHPATLQTNNNNLHKELFELFVANNFYLNEKEIKLFTQSNGIFIESFLESINDQYYEILDDLLVEKDDNGYLLNQEYYEQVITNS